MPKTVQLRETATVGAAAATAAKTKGRMLIQLINPGKGSSGYYPAPVLEQAAKDRVFPAGTLMFLDHPSATENAERPERSVKDLAAVLTSDAVWSGDALVGEAQVFAPYRQAIAEMKDAIGTSIRASARVNENGEADGYRGRIVEQLLPGVGNSVDFVTYAGRGGKVLEVLESARANATVDEARNLAQWLESRIHQSFTNIVDELAGDGHMTREERIGLSSAIGDALAAFNARVETDQPHLYTRDPFADPSLPTPVGEGTDVPSIRPGSTNPNPKEIPMGKIEIEEAEHTRLVGIAGRVEALEAERDTEKAAREAAETALAEAKKPAPPTAPRTPRQVMEERDKDLRDQVAQLRAREAARDIVTTELAEAWLAPTTIARLSVELMESLPIVNDELDVNALRARCVEKRDQHEVEAAEALTAAGVGTPRGLGGLSTKATESAAASATEGLNDAFQKLGLSESAAQTAVKGR